VHLPVIDWLFGTFYLPQDRWPGSYGLADGTQVPEGFMRQFVEPFVRRPD
jgi:lathosterol oxidase